MRRPFRIAALLVIIAALTVSCLPNTAAQSASGLERTAAVQKPVTASAEPATLQTAGGTQTAADYTVASYRSFVRLVAGQYLARIPSFSVRYNACSDELDAAGETVMSDAIGYDDPTTTSDLDYLKWNMDSFQYRATLYKAPSGSYAVYVFSQTYRTTAENEAYVNAAAYDILATLNVGSSCGYDKVKAVHDFIIKHVDYDWTQTKYTAYDALASGKTVCQGYSLLTYKLLSELGIPVRIISGEAGGGAHGWNIVKLGQFWYNLDVTWDDTTGRTTKWFLKSDASFSDHIRDDEYASDAFYAQYPMAPADYDPAYENGQPDVPGAWAMDKINALSARGVVPEALLSRYQSAISRAEFTALVSNVYEYARGAYTPTGAPPFVDIEASPYTAQISKCYGLGIIGGTDGTSFSPDGTLTREQCAKIISAAAGVINGTSAISDAALPFLDTGAVSGWALPYVRYAYENGLMRGTGVNFEPQTVLTREQAMVVAESMIENYGW